MTEEYAEVAGEEQDLDAQLDQQQDGGGAAPSPEDLKKEQAVGVCNPTCKLCLTGWLRCLL